MQHLLARVTFATNPKAALKFTDTVIKAAEAYDRLPGSAAIADNLRREQHVPWVYALRFLRSSLAIRGSSSQETVNAIGHLRQICSLANSRGDRAVSATAALFEAMAHLTRTNVSESIENAQTALAAARAAQFDPMTSGIHQLVVMSQLVDICCHLYRDEMEAVSPLMASFIEAVDGTLKPDTPWAANGLVLIPLAPLSANTLPALGSSDGVICRDGRGNTCMQIYWVPKGEIHPLGSLICAAVYLHKNSQGQRAEAYLREAASTSKARKAASSLTCAGLIDDAVDFTPASKPAETWQHMLRCHAQINLVFALCGRSAWGAAQKELSALRDMAQTVPAARAPALVLYTLYLEGAISQGTGDTAAALATFRRPEFALDPPPAAKTPAAHPQSALRRDLALLAHLNVALIIHVPGHPDRAALPDLVAALEPRAVASASVNVRAALRFVRAVAFNAAGAGAETGGPAPPPSGLDSGLTGGGSAAGGPGGGSLLLRTKENLAAVLHDAKRTANVQLLGLTLAFMAEKYFAGVVGAQALKSARSALQWARKGQNDLWTSVAAGRLAATFDTQGMGDEAARARAEALDLAARLPLVMQRAAEGPAEAGPAAYGL